MEHLVAPDGNFPPRPFLAIGFLETEGRSWRRTKILASTAIPIPGLRSLGIEIAEVEIGSVGEGACTGP
jgi:hypothetical protein